MMRRLVGAFGVLVGVAVLCGAANRNLHGRDRLPQPAGRPDLEAIRLELEGQRGTVRGMKVELECLHRALEDRAALVATLNQALRAIEISHPDGIPQETHTRYLRVARERASLVAEHKAASLRYGAMHAEYRSLVANYAQRVENARARARAAGDGGAALLLLASAQL